MSQRTTYQEDGTPTPPSYRHHHQLQPVSTAHLRRRAGQGRSRPDLGLTDEVGGGGGRLLAILVDFCRHGFCVLCVVLLFSSNESCRCKTLDGDGVISEKSPCRMPSPCLRMPRKTFSREYAATTALRELDLKHRELQRKRYRLPVGIVVRARRREVRASDE